MHYGRWKSRQRSVCMAGLWSSQRSVSRLETTSNLSRSNHESHTTVDVCHRAHESLVVHLTTYQQQSPPMLMLMLMLRLLWRCCARTAGRERATTPATLCLVSIDVINGPKGGANERQALTCNSLASAANSNSELAHLATFHRQKHKQNIKGKRAIGCHQRRCCLQSVSTCRAPTHPQSYHQRRTR